MYRSSNGCGQIRNYDHQYYGSQRFNVVAYRSVLLRKLIIIGICGAVIAVIVFILIPYLVLNSLQAVQFSPNSVGRFDNATLTLEVFVDACNPTQMPTGFDKMLFELDYKNKEFAKMVLQGNTLMPQQAVTLKGRIHINADTVENWWQAYNVFTGLEHQYINLKATVDAKVLGFIPVDVERNFSYDEFVALVVSPQATQFSCK